MAETLSSPLRPDQERNDLEFRHMVNTEFGGLPPAGQDSGDKVITLFDLYGKKIEITDGMRMPTSLTTCPMDENQKPTMDNDTAENP